MKSGLYMKLSVNGIKKNKKLYLPYLITCICMVMMFYLIDYLAVSPQFAQIKGGDTMQMILGFGSGVIAIFSLILLYYTNSFLIRRRQREFGLYHILGMGKIDLVKIMVLENLLISVLTIAGGIVGGILFSKLGELLAAKILVSNAGLSMKISVQALVATVLLFLAIFALIMLRMIVSVYRLKPVELLKSEKTGEKPPKANWIFAVLGLLLLGVAYYLSLTIKDPLVAMIWFMVAVVLVILATYLLFIAGSVTFCKIMQKKKGYYYKTNHFVSLSSMIYRMKRNGAGLASICILSTMVLVMVSSTTSLYLSMEHGLNLRYPKSVQIEMYTKPEQTEEMKENQNGQIIELVQKVLKEHNQTAENPEKVLAAYSEDYHLGLWVTGKRVANSWAHPDENSSVYELKAYVENVFARLGLHMHDLVVGNLTDDIYAAGLSVQTRGGKRLATFGIVTKKLLKAFDIDNEVYYADFNWKELLKAIRNVKVSYTEISKFPAVKRDLALLLDKKVQFAEIEKIAYETEKKLLKEVSLFDVYEGKNLEAGKKSYAVSFLLQDENATLNDKQIDKIMSKLVKNLEDKLNAKLR